MKTKLLHLDKIVTSAGTQIRASIDSDTVNEYAEGMQEKNQFPPVVVFHNGSQFILADGFHRVMAANRNGSKSISAEIRKGTKADALRFALGANVAHGLKRTNADKRRSVELALAEWPNVSDRQIAEICAVGDHLVADVRSTNCVNPAVDQPQPRIGKDGRLRKLPKKTSETELELPAPPSEPEPEEKPQVIARDPAEALGNLQAARVITAFQSWFDLNFHGKEARTWALGLIVEQADSMLKKERQA